MLAMCLSIILLFPDAGSIQGPHLAHFQTEWSEATRLINFPPLCGHFQSLTLYCNVASVTVIFWCYVCDYCSP